eukprot:2699794-Pleurochrysis_carterae.AAC.1
MEGEGQTRLHVRGGADAAACADDRKPLLAARAAGADQRPPRVGEPQGAGDDSHESKCGSAWQASP